MYALLPCVSHHLIPTLAHPSGIPSQMTTRFLRDLRAAPISGDLTLLSYLLRSPGGLRVILLHGDDGMPLRNGPVLTCYADIGLCTLAERDRELLSSFFVLLF